MADGKTLTMPSAKSESASAPQPKPERMIPLKLRRGYWAKPGTEFQAPIYEETAGTDEGGRRTVVRTITGYSDGVVSATEDESARKKEKLLAGYRVTLPIGEAKPLLDAGKAELDAGY